MIRPPPQLCFVITHLYRLTSQQGGGPDIIRKEGIIVHGIGGGREQRTSPPPPPPINLTNPATPHARSNPEYKPFGFSLISAPPPLPPLTAYSDCALRNSTLTAADWIAPP